MADNETFPSRILIREGRKLHVIPIEQVDFIEARGSAVELGVGGRRLRKAQALTSLETHLDPVAFLRVHRSYIVNLNSIRGLEASSHGHVAVLADGSRIPISRRSYMRLCIALDGFSVP